MKNTQHYPTVTVLRAFLDYDRETDTLRWADEEEAHKSTGIRMRSGNSGKLALNTPLGKTGMRQGHILGVLLRKHIVVWALSRGEYPRGNITTVDGNWGNTRPDNLVLVVNNNAIRLPAIRMKERVSVERLMEVIRYDRLRGDIFWKTPQERGATKRSPQDRLAGKVALNSLRKSGNRKGTIDGIHVYKHHAVWALVNGEWPTHRLAFLDGDRSNCRITNLYIPTEEL